MVAFTIHVHLHVASFIYTCICQALFHVYMLFHAQQGDRGLGGREGDIKHCFSSLNKSLYTAWAPPAFLEGGGGGGGGARIGQGGTI